MEKTAKGELTQEYLKKFPSHSSRKIAAVLLEKFPNEFKHLEDARDMVRYYRGESKSFKVSQGNYVPRITVPQGEDSDFSPYVIPSDAWPIFAAGDVHLPYHDQDALEIFLESAYNAKAKTILMAGDWLDMYQVSRWQKDPRLRNVKEEIKIFNEVLDMIQKSMPNTKIIFKIGNHENRFDNYLMANAPALFDMEEMHLESILKLNERGIDVVKDKQIIRFGHLNIIHGHEYVFSISNPVNPARGLYNRAKKSTICFHHHQSSEHTEPAIDGSVVTCWSVGCLCGLRPDYMPLNKWNHGFAEIYGGDNGEFTVRNRRIVNYKVF